MLRPLGPTEVLGSKWSVDYASWSHYITILSLIRRVTLVVHNGKVAVIVTHFLIQFLYPNMPICIIHMLYAKTESINALSYEVHVFKSRTTNKPKTRKSFNVIMIDYLQPFDQVLILEARRMCACSGKDLWMVAEKFHQNMISFVHWFIKFAFFLHNGRKL